MNSERKIEELEILLSTIEDEGGNRGHWDRLNALLHGDPLTCEFYIRYQHMLAALQLEIDAVPVQLADEDKPEVGISLRTTQMIVQSSPRVATTKWNTPWWIATAAAFAVTFSMVGLYALSLNGRQSSALLPNTQNEADRSSVAVLTRALDSRFENRSYRVDDTLRPGNYGLSEGMIQIEFFSGAHLLIEAPADFEIVDENQVLFRVGRARVRVPEQAGSFVLAGGGGRVLARNGEYGFSIEGTSHELHALTGNLVWENASGVKAEIPQGEARMISYGAAFGEPIDADDRSFLSWFDILEKSRAKASQRYRQWRKSSAAASENKSVVANFSFENASASDRKLRNAANEDGPAGAIIGCRWSRGRWTEKGALEFRSHSDRVRFSLGKLKSSLSVLAWVQLEPALGRTRSILAPESKSKGLPHWQINSEGALEVAIPLGNGKWEKVASAPLKPEVTNGKRWHQIAVTIDFANGLVAQYLDGKPIANGSFTDAYTLDFGMVQVGNLPREKVQSPSHLGGLIDELTIFEVALEPGDVLTHFKDGRP